MQVSVFRQLKSPGKRHYSREPFELDELSITELQQALHDGRYTSRSLVEKYLKRIEGIDTRGIQLSSVIELNPHALSLADEADANRKGGATLGPLHGIPFLVKDNIDTGD